MEKNNLLTCNCVLLGVLPTQKRAGFSCAGLSRRWGSAGLLDAALALVCAGLFATACAPVAVLAADSEWNVDADGLWTTDSNWTAAAPGSISGTTSTDVATFSSTLTLFGKAITVDANRNIAGISFGNTSSFGFTLSGGNLLLTSAGVIQTLAGDAAHMDTVPSAIAIQGDGGSASFTALSGNGSNLLNIAGVVTGVSTAGNTTTLNLNGTNIGGNVITGTVANGAGGGKLALAKSDAGAWQLNGSNTYTGTTTLSAGTLIANNAAALGNGGDITFGGGTLQYTLASAGQDWGARFKNTVAGGILLNTSNNDVTLAGVIDASNTAGLTKSGGGTLTLSGANTYTGVTTIGGTVMSILRLNSASALGGGGNITFTGGRLQYTTNNTVDYSARIVGSSGAITIDTNGQNVSFGSVLAASNTNGLNKLGTGDLTFGGNISHFYTGNTSLNGGRLILDNTGTGNNNANRITDGSNLTLNNGTFVYKGSDQAATDSSETVGGINVGVGTLTVAFSGTNTVTLTGANLGQSNRGSFLVNGTNLGMDTASTASVGRLKITSAPTLFGTTNALDTGINVAAQDTKIVSFLVGEATATSGGAGTATGIANTFVTWNANTGLRPLNPTDEFVQNAITAAKNNRITSATTASASAAINSLVMNGGDLTISSGQNLTNTSGAILFASSGTIKTIGGASGFLFTGGNQEYLISVNSGVTATISSPFTGTADGNQISLSGSGTLNLRGNSTLNIDENGNRSSRLVAEGGGTLNVTGVITAFAPSASNRSNGTNLVGQTSSGNTLNVAETGRLRAGGMTVGGDIFGNNTVTISSPGNAGAPSYHMHGNGAQLNMGVSSSGNTFTVSSGAYVRQDQGGGGNAWTIGTNAGGDNNAILITGIGSTVNRGGAAGSELAIGGVGNSNSVTVNGGGNLTPRRTRFGFNGGSGNFGLITGQRSSYNLPSDSNNVFALGGGVGSQNNYFSVEAGGVATILNTLNTSREFNVGYANAADNNYVRVTGLSSLITISLSQPWTFGGTDRGSGSTPVDFNAKGNHLDVFDRGTLVSSTVEMMGVSSAFNLGNGSGISTATVGNALVHSQTGVVLRNADSRLNFNGGRLIAGAAGSLVSGLGTVVLNGPAYISTTQTNSSISTVIADATGIGSLTKEGTGTLILSNANTYTGTTNVNAGTLALDYTIVGSKLADTSTLTLGGGTLNLRNGAVSLVEVVGSTSLNAGLSQVTQTTSASTLRANTITPGIGVVNFGAANIADTDNLNDASDAGGILGAWATVGGLDWAINSTGTADGAITAYTGYTSYNPYGSTLANNAANNARLGIAAGSGDITLEAATTTVNTLLQSNTLGAAVVQTAGGVLAANGIMIAANGDALTIGGAAGDGALQSATASGTLVLNNSNSATLLTINAPITDNGGASALATVGTLRLNGVNTYTGATGVGGTLTLDGAAQLGGGTYAGAISIATAGKLVVNSSANQILSGVISGDGSFTQSGLGTTTLSGANTYTGATTVSGGILVAGHAGAFGGTSTAAIVFESGSTGTVRWNGNNITVVGLNTNATPGTPVIESGSNAPGTDTLTLDAGRTTTGALSNSTYAGVLQNGATRLLALVKNGPADLTLSGSSTYTGGTTVNAGSLTLANQNGLGTGTLTLAEASLFQQAVFEGNTAAGAIANVLNLSGGQVFFNIPSTQKDIWLDQDVSGPGAMRLLSDASGRTLTLSGAKTFLGGIRQTSGSLISTGTGSSQYPSVAIDNVASLGTGTFRAQIIGSDSTKGVLRTLADLSGGAGVANAFEIAASSRLVLEASDTNHLKLSGAITGGGSLVKTGSARLTLAGNNTYTGSTTISTGTLLATHPAAFGGTSGVTVASAAGLAYAATVDAPLVINGTLSITGGTGSTTTTIGTAIGSTASSATIFTNGTATATAGSITVDIAGILGVVPVNGNYTLLGGPTGSTLSALASYSLGKVYNPSNFTIGSLEASATALSVAVTAQVPLDSIYYTGGLANGNGEWAMSNGSTASNWAADAAGLATSLTPGASSNVQFTNPGAALPNAMTLGRDMTINSIAVKGSSTVNLSLLPAGENTLTIGSPGSLNSGITVDAGAGSVTLSPTTIKLGTQQSWSNNSTQALTIGAAVDTAGFLLTAGGSGTTTLSGVVSGSGGLTNGGSGVLSLSGVNSYTGLTTIGAGVLQVASTLALPGGIGATGGTSALTFNGGVIGLSEGNFYRPVAAAGIASGVHFTGAGGWAASGAHRTVNLGGAGSSIAWGAADTGLNGQTLILGAATATHTVDFQNPINLGNALRTVRVDNGSAAVDGTLSGVLSGSAGGTLTKTGLGTLKITGANTFTGGTAIEAGTLVLASESALGTGGPLTLNAGTLDLNGKSITTGALGGAGGTITTGVSGATILTVNSASNSTFAGEIADGVIGTVGLTKSGSGSLTLAGVNVYSGSTVVEAGRLAIDGSINTDVSIASGAFLGGSGTIGDATFTGALTGAGTIGPGGPGGAAGILTAYTFDPTEGLGAAFEFTSAGLPDFTQPTNSINDVLNLTAMTDDPFAAWNLTLANAIDIYFNVDSILPADRFQGGLFVRVGAGSYFYTANELLVEVRDATYHYWSKATGGAQIFNGINYERFTSEVTLGAIEIGTTGFLTTFTIGTLSVPEPNSIVLAGIGIGMAAWSLWKRRRI